MFNLGRQRVRSKVIDNNLNPVWNETLMLAWDGQSVLLAEVFDKDLTSEDGNNNNPYESAAIFHD